MQANVIFVILLCKLNMKANISTVHEGKNTVKCDICGAKLTLVHEVQFMKKRWHSNATYAMSALVKK